MGVAFLCIHDAYCCDWLIKQWAPEHSVPGAIIFKGLLIPECAPQAAAARLNAIDTTSWDSLD
ncbi:hypothetical protein ANCDUO_22504 [Ancylostoma duodenale]|uniref:Uncharacterized protein n=1 Tax=Ancylostoma duodenale TaxID=51022 RepID=A0A0C2CC79_9BILA|nr:hypothetical protein ANCDUO_22504 [Ancylostoma duodenale]